MECILECKVIDALETALATMNSIGNGCRMLRIAIMEVIFSKAWAKSKTLF